MPEINPAAAAGTPTAGIVDPAPKPHDVPAGSDAADITRLREAAGRMAAGVAAPPAADALQGAGRAWMEESQRLAQRRMQQMMRLTQVRSLPDLLNLQQEMVREEVEELNGFLGRMSALANPGRPQDR
ncbi:MAG TPA: hypothetical protein VED40_12145 [Azospirillaceae bacterium]|nr:hypothetical protein [Azospirillaceae bacterium]